ncbi:MAG: MAPEG family protein [Caulobacterales bacterium]
MFSGSISHAFTAYAVTCLVLCLNLLVLWGYSGGVRTSAKSTANPEDAKLFKSELSEVEPPALTRTLRAHANAEAAIYPFLFLGLVYVLAGGAAKVAAIIFAVFVVARLAHSAFYVAAVQPWRTISFTVGALATLVLMGALVVRLVQMGH